MSVLRVMSRAAVGGYLKAVRLPFDAAVRMRGRGPGAERAQITLDRLEATARKAAGRALRDDRLSEDATLRTVAADERERALALRAAATERAGEAQEQYDEKTQQAKRRRSTAARNAQEKRRRAAEQRDATVRQGSRSAAQRRGAIEAVAER